MQPGPNGRVTGAFTLPQPVIVGDHVRALVGVLPGATGTVEFSVTANGILLAPTVTDTSADGALKLLDVDLGPRWARRRCRCSVEAVCRRRPTTGRSSRTCGSRA